MRTLLWVIGIFAAAVGLVLAARYNDGYALVVLPPYRIEISLNLLALLLLGAMLAGYAVLRLVYGAVRLPARVREYRLARERVRARAALLKALEAWFAGRYAEAETVAVEALAGGEAAELATVVAARAAHARGDRSGSEAHLARLDGDARSAALAAWTRAELLLGEARAADALEVLERLPERHAAAVRLELEARRLLGDWDRVEMLAAELSDKGAIDSSQANELRVHALAERLTVCNQKEALIATWNAISDEDRHHPRVVDAGARAFLRLGLAGEAQRLIEDALERHWSSALVALYACCAQDAMEAGREERWLARHPNDPGLHLALGEIHARQALWARAAQHFELSLALRPTIAAHLGLARVKVGLGEAAAAQAHLAAAHTLSLTRLASDAFRDSSEERLTPHAQPGASRRLSGARPDEQPEVREARRRIAAPSGEPPAGAALQPAAVSGGTAGVKASE
jgi:HemY protein